MRFTVEPGLPEYGSSLDSEALFGEPEASVDVDVEVPAARWLPVPADAAFAAAATVLFVDGVQRVDARIWIPNEDVSRAGVCVSYAAGVVRCTQREALIECVQVRRAVLAPAPVQSIELGSTGTYEAATLATDEAENARRELQRRLRDLEVQVVGEATGGELTVVDGHLRGREDVPGAVGYIKSHQSSYLPPEVRGVVAKLAPGERTPLFVVQSSWSRFSWYLRLALPAGGPAHPWAGVVRCEVASSLDLGEALRRANLASATLPRYSSEGHKDPRAPQNLYPIGGLERELRRRLGDQQLLYRDLLAAAGG
jgi:hypothetical protein